MKLFFVVQLLLFVYSETFYWGSYTINARIKVINRSKITGCKNSAFSPIYLYPYDGTLENAIQNCGLACVGWQIESNNTLACTGFRIVSEYTCQTFKCVNPKVKRSHQKTKQIVFIYT